MDPDVAQGIFVATVGMALVFSALLAVMVAIGVLHRLFRPRGTEEGPVASHAGGTPTPSTRQAPEQERVAAIAVALALAQQETWLGANRAPLSPMPPSQPQPSPWNILGRQGQMNTRL